jgi:hypothetical protein
MAPSGAFFYWGIEMLDIYDLEDEGDNAQYPWPTVCRHMGQLCFILTKVFKGFDLA